jgi:hypothetical protein
MTPDPIHRADHDHDRFPGKKREQTVAIMRYIMGRGAGVMQACGAGPVRDTLAGTGRRVVLE